MQEKWFKGLLITFIATTMFFVVITSRKIITYDIIDGAENPTSELYLLFCTLEKKVLFLYQIY